MSGIVRDVARERASVDVAGLAAPCMLAASDFTHAAVEDLTEHLQAGDEIQVRPPARPALLLPPTGGGGGHVTGEDYYSAAGPISPAFRACTPQSMATASKQAAWSCFNGSCRATRRVPAPGPVATRPGGEGRKVLSSSTCCAVHASIRACQATLFVSLRFGLLPAGTAFISWPPEAWWRPQRAGAHHQGPGGQAGRHAAQPRARVPRGQAQGAGVQAQAADGREQAAAG